MTDLSAHEAFVQRCKEADRLPIPGYEGLYDATSDGFIISCKRSIERSNGRLLNKVERVMKPGRTHGGSGYQIVTLSKNGKGKCFTVHSLVALTFIGERPDGFQCCHNDGNVDNNSVSNLRYDTPKGNNADKMNHGTNRSHSKLSECDVRNIRKRLSEGVKQRDVADEFGVSKSLIWAINTKRVWANV